MLGTYPLEHMAAVTPRVNPEQTWRIYDALAVLAGVERPVTVADPRVSADLLVHEDGRRFAFLVSQSPDKLQVEASGVGTVTLAPYGVEVLEVIT